MKNKKILKRIILTAVILTAIIVIYAMSVSAYVKSSQKDKILETDSITGTYDCIIVLGCGVREDGTPSSMLADRLEKAVELYKLGVAPVILMSGDHGSNDYDEVSVMKEYAQNAGVLPEDIFLDHAGFSTYESIYRAKEVFGVSNAVIVTQEYHLYRALYMAETFGISAVGSDAGTRTYGGQFLRDVREIIARNKDFLYCIFKPEPTYMGEKIPLTSDGGITQ